ncbi:hypothetical protein VQ056_15095 [Paenibacillus sp. JTLBN-2024]
MKELSKETGDMYVLYHKYKDLNSGLDLSYWGGIEEFSAYEDYFEKSFRIGGFDPEAARKPASWIQILVSDHRRSNKREIR